MPEDTQQAPFELPKDGEAFPEDLAALLSYRIQTARNIEFHGRPHSLQQLQALVSGAFQASLQSEEGRPVRFQLLFDLFPKQITIPFKRPIEYSAQPLVRLAPTIGLGFRWLVVAPADPVQDPLRIVGVPAPGAHLKAFPCTAHVVSTTQSPGQGRTCALIPGRLKISAFTRGGP